MCKFTLRIAVPANLWCISLHLNFRKFCEFHTTCGCSIETNHLVLPCGTLWCFIFTSLATASSSFYIARYRELFISHRSLPLAVHFLTSLATARAPYFVGICAHSRSNSRFRSNSRSENSGKFSSFHTTCG